jgi:methionyl-tRNA formyltransferase
MKEIGAQLLVKTVKGLVDGTVNEQPQSDIRHPTSDILHHAPKIFTEICKIDFTKSADEVHNLIRGLSPFPGAFTSLNGKILKIYRSEKQTGPVASATGTYESDGKTFLKFACADGYILAKELQLEGKKKMLVEDFLRGYRFE